MAQKVDILRSLVNERLTAAAEEIFALVERTIVEYEEELCRSKEENQRKQQLLDPVVSPTVHLHKAEAVSTSSAEPSPSWKQSVCDFLQIKEECGPGVEFKEGIPRDSSSVVTHLPEKTHSQPQTLNFTENIQEVFQKSTTKTVSTSSAEPSPPWKHNVCDFLQIKEEHDPRAEFQEETPGQSASVPTRLGEKTDTRTQTHTYAENIQEVFQNWGIPLNSNLEENQPNFQGLGFPAVNRDNETSRQDGNVLHKRFIGGRRGNKTLFCSVCNKKFTWTHDLRRHELSHEAKPYSCPVCKKSFAREDSVDVHMALHTGKQLFQCPLCQKPFTRSNNLRKHMQTIHVQCKLFSCSFCRREFSTKDSLKMHMFLHTGDKPFRCSLCDKSYTRRQQLKLHMSNHAEGTSRT